MSIDNTGIAEQAIRALGFYRRLIIDSLEQDLIDSPNWKYVRGRVLRALGENGLEGQLRNILNYPIAPLHERDTGKE